MRNAIFWLQKGSAALAALMEFITDITASVGAIVLVAIVLMVTVAVMLRYGFSQAVGWSTEVAEYALYIVVMLASPWVLKKDGHIRLDFFVDFLPSPAKERMLVLTNLLGAFVCLVFFYYGTIATRAAYISGDRLAGVLPVPKFFVLFFIPLMSALCFFQFARKIGKDKQSPASLIESDSE